VTEHFGPYELIELLGRGGMGEVWRAVDTRKGRTVALKRLPAEMTGEREFEDRFRREAHAAARLNDPHVIPIHDFGEIEGRLFLDMRLVAGDDLGAVVEKEGALEPARAVSVLEQVASALDAAHDEGLVHRDVKPSNILVTPEGQVKLSDFGIARAEADSSLTQTGLVTGSPSYLAPEVASGQQATASSDVWSLGATAFHALAGHPPYEVGDNVMGALYRIVHEEPPRLPDAGWLDALLDNTMTKDPAQRWPMSQVRDFLDGGPLAAPVHAEQTRTATVVRDAPPLPVPAAAPPVSDGTQVLPPAVVEPGRRRGPGGAVIGVVVGLLVVGLFLLFAWLFGAFDPQEENGSEPLGDQTSDPQTPEGTTSSPPDGSDARAEAMETFVDDYVAAAIEDPQVSWDLLTPDFQSASGSFGQYKKYWDQWDSAVPANIQADPDALTVNYDITYQDDDGTRRDNVTLTLEENGDGFLIAAEGR
jgi:eukaryotic-like serine/threonine-protein kinase